MFDMNDMHGRKFVASYSGGKDSVLAIYRAISAGLKPHSLITTHNTDENRSWFHGMTGELLIQVSESLSIPLSLIKTTGADYQMSFEKALSDAKSNGAEVCVFGDIDLEGHLKWCTERCEKTGLVPYFPLLKEQRKKVVYEFIDVGFSAIIKIVDTSRLPERFLGQVLSREVVNDIEKCGADICGENGEYHTFVFDGPLFSSRISFSTEEIFRRDKYAVQNIVSCHK